MRFIGKVDFGNNIKFDELNLRNIFSLEDKFSINSYRNVPIEIAYFDDIYTKQSDVKVLKSKDSLLIGTAYSKKTWAPIHEDQLKQWNGSRFESFIDAYWGCYILFSTNPKSRNVNILRAPSGQLPFYYYRDSSLGILYFSSQIEYIFKVIGNKPSFDWDYLKRYVVHGVFSGHQTAFKGVTELCMGCELELSPKMLKQRLVWDPSEIATQKEADDEYWTASLVNTISHVLEAHTKSAEEIYIEFSGGIDSTAVLLCTNNVLNSNQSLTGLHLYDPEVQAANELDLATKIGGSIGRTIIGINYLNLLPFKRPKGLEKPNKPSNMLPFQAQEKYLNSCRKGNKSFRYLHGHGGDNLLLDAPYNEILADYWMDWGFSNIMCLIKDMVIRERMPIYYMLKDAMIGSLSPLFRIRYLEKTPSSLKIPWFTRQLRKYYSIVPKHPYFEKRRKTPPGKGKQIVDMYRALDFVSNNIRTPGNYAFSPFLSQPVLELIFSIPTYRHVSEGHTRYLIRKGIADRFKTDYIWRKDKGEHSSIIQKGMKENREYLLKLCLDGQFAREGLIKKDLLKTSIENEIAGSNEGQHALFYLIACEMFMEYWHS